MIIVPGSNSSDLAYKVSQLLGAELAKTSTKRFVDGEIYVRIDGKLKGQTVAIVQTCYPKQNDSIIELALLADAARNKGASTIIAVVPYVAYSRQDKIFQPGEALSLKTIFDMLRSSGIFTLITVDSHFQRKIGRSEINGMDVINLSAAKVLFDAAKEKIGGDVYVIGPDLGSTNMVIYATGRSDVMKKEKICPDCHKLTTECRCVGEKKEYYVADIISEMDVKGKKILIMDDMITSGTTMIRAVDKIRGEEAQSVAAMATHGLFLNDSLLLLKSKTDMLAVTDSIQTPVSSVSIAPILAKALKEV